MNSFNKFFSFVLLVAMLSSCSLIEKMTGQKEIPEDNLHYNDIKLNISEYENDEIDNKLDETFKYVFHTGDYGEIKDYYFEYLDPLQKEVYYCIYKNFPGDDFHYDFGTGLDIDLNSAQEIYELFFYNHCFIEDVEYNLRFIFENEEESSKTGEELKGLKGFFINRVDPSFSQQEKIEVLNKHTEEILKLLPSVNSDDYIKAKAALDILLELTEYGNGPNYDNEYGPIVDGMAICSGYSVAYKYLAQKLGLECICVSGIVSNISHEWNMVKVDGSWYHVDVTFIDGSPDDYSKFFLVSDEDMKKERSDFVLAYLQRIKAPEAPYNYH